MGLIDAWRLRGLTLAVTRLGGEAVTFAVLRGLTLVGGVAALFLVPPSPQHQLHLAPLLGGFIAYKASLFLVLVRWAERAREIAAQELEPEREVVQLDRRDSGWGWEFEHRRRS